MKKVLQPRAQDSPWYGSTRVDMVIIPFSALTLLKVVSFFGCANANKFESGKTCRA